MYHQIIEISLKVEFKSMDDEKLGALLNVRLNKEYRLVRLLECLGRISLLNLSSISVRVRGQLSELAEREIRCKFPQVTIFLGDRAKSWRLNTLEQLVEMDVSYVLLLQEDHLLIADPGVCNLMFKDLIREKIDICPVSGFALHGDQRERMIKSPLCRINSRFLILDNVLDYKINQGISKPGYFVNLVSFYSKKKIAQILLSERPHIRKFHHLTPYDVEQNTKQKWFFPVNFALPTEEIFGCIDDDIHHPGSSLQSRGLYPLDQVRADEHHPNNLGSLKLLIRIQEFIRLRISKEGLSALFKSIRMRRLTGQFLHTVVLTFRFFRMVEYTFQHKLYLMTDSSDRKIRRELKKMVRTD